MGQHVHRQRNIPFLSDLVVLLPDRVFGMGRGGFGGGFVKGLEVTEIEALVIPPPKVKRSLGLNRRDLGAGELELV